MERCQCADLAEIARVKARYCEAADASATDPERAAILFEQVLCEDAVCDFGFIRIEGRAELVAYLSREYGASADWVQHAVGTPDIQVGAERCFGKWTMSTRMATRPNGDVVTMCGRYEDEFRREGGSWKIASLLITEMR